MSSLNVNFSQSISRSSILLQAHDLKLQITPTRERALKSIKKLAQLRLVYMRMNFIYPPRRSFDLQKLTVIETILNMYNLHRKYQLILHLLSKIHLNSNNLSKFGMRSISRGEILTSLSLISRQLSYISKKFSKITTQKCFLLNNTLEFSRINLNFNLTLISLKIGISTPSI